MKYERELPVGFVICYNTGLQLCVRVSCAGLRVVVYLEDRARWN